GLVFNSQGEKVVVSVNSAGYQIFGTGSRRYKDNPFFNIAVHRLQAFQKYGNKIFLNKIVVRHFDEDKLNNKPENILIGTQKDNYHDVPKKKREKIIAKMAETKSQYSNEQAKEMFELRSKGVLQKDIAKKFKCSTGWISMILNNKTTYTNRINNLKP
ncbi:MAG: HNH endonuclease, partial [Gelidibacter sp.]|nr:HNH endonuclease [Gelidibacter sp.]